MHLMTCDDLRLSAPATSCCKSGDHSRPDKAEEESSEVTHWYHNRYVDSGETDTTMPRMSLLIEGTSACQMLVWWLFLWAFPSLSCVVERITNKEELDAGRFVALIQQLLFQDKRSTSYRVKNESSCWTSSFFIASASSNLGGRDNAEALALKVGSAG